jgi:pantetheine-phosphate adenylyltransferase
MRRAVFPGSFDPFTNGHMDIMKRAIPLFDEIIVAVGQNFEKKYLCTLDQRLHFLKEIFKNEKKVKVDHYVGLTVNFCKYREAQYIIRGLRSAPDYSFEEQIARMNQALNPEIETVLLVSSVEYQAISSTIVRDIILHGGDYKKFVPDAVRVEQA